jgi:hypothetical protein
MTFTVLKVLETNYETVEIESNGNDIVFYVHDEIPAESQLIKIPLADWPEVRAYIDALYKKAEQ